MSIIEKFSIEMARHRKKSDLEKLKEANSLATFAKLLGYKPKGLSYILYAKKHGQYYCNYSEIKIPKKNGTERVLQIPSDQLKRLQKCLLKLL